MNIKHRSLKLRKIDNIVQEEREAPPVKSQSYLLTKKVVPMFP